MPQKPIDHTLQNLIRDRAVNAEETAESVEADVRQLAKEHRLKVPSLRTVSRYLGEYRKTRATSPYRLFRWPEHMGAGEGLLPWESSRACLDLLGYADREGLGEPIVLLAQRFWQATQSAPDAEVRHRASIAVRLALRRLDGLAECLARRDYENLPELTLTEEELFAEGAWYLVRGAIRLSLGAELHRESQNGGK